MQVKGPVISPWSQGLSSEPHPHRPFSHHAKPTERKSFCMAGMLSFVCALGVVTALGTPLWIKATFLCKTGALLVNASGPGAGQVHGRDAVRAFPWRGHETVWPGKEALPVLV